MYKIVEGNTLNLADVGKFIDVINELPNGLSGFFDGREDIFVTRAPGRLDVMGGIADYSGSLVLEMPIAESTVAAIQKSDDRQIKIVSLHVNSRTFSTFAMDLADLELGNQTTDYTRIKEFFSRDSSNNWASYAAGIFFVLKRELGVGFQTGARILIVVLPGRPPFTLRLNPGAGAVKASASSLPASPATFGIVTARSSTLRLFNGK